MRYAQNKVASGGGQMGTALAEAQLGLLLFGYTNLNSVPCVDFQQI